MESHGPLLSGTKVHTVDELMDLLHACRDAWDTPDRSGDPVDLHDHALQTAALLRRSHPADKELQVAGLVHDLGHLLRPGEDAAHADVAADAVHALLGHRVAALVRLHVPAKRYLAATEPGRALSPQSARTLAAQGGVMAYEEAMTFADGPHAQDAITLRQADDAGKVVGLDAGVMEDWRPVLELVASAVR
ncbi:HD domain-containing protein [Streptomyces sp. TRM66268-LWL]|uniref:HD domain-containing protein n=1 Tax=Streptomyces polyasparticus TaxID=2767826 RepID=A0ABR7SE57_9ACTN|nr:inositol oxygenase family protein [Streptomyces polyasparticus]MBC9713782.1 HD domain-containing protein [Streptomyces polyasparticus]